MGDILEHDLGGIRSRCAGGGDRLILIIVIRIGLVAIGRGGSLDELRLVLDAGHLIGADDLVVVGAVHQLDQNIGIIGGVLLIEELHVLILGLVVGDEEALAGVALHLVARDLRGGDGDGLAGGDALVAGLVQIQDLTVFITHIGVDRDVLGLGLILVGHGDVVGAVELRRVTSGGSVAVRSCTHQLIVVEGGRSLGALVGGLPLHQRTAGEGAQIVRDTCAVHIDRLVDQIARSLLIHKGDSIIAVLRRRKVLGILVVLGLIADEVGGGDGGLLVQLILHHLIGVVRDGVAIGVRRLDGNIRHVPIVVEHDHLIALSEVDGVLGRCVGGVQLGGVLRERVVELVRFVLVVGLAAERTAGFHSLPLLPRPAVDRLLCETVLAVADRGILPQLRFRTVLSANAHNIDERSGGGNNITSRSNGNIAAHIAYDDLDLAIAVRVTAQMLLLDGHLGGSIAAFFLGGIHRPAVAPVVFCPGLGQNIVADDLSFLVRDGQLFAVQLPAGVSGRGGGEGLAMPSVVSIGPCDIGADIFVHPVVAQVDLVIGFLCRIGNGLVDWCAVLHGDGVLLVRQRNAGTAALRCRNGGCRIIRIQRIRAGGGDLVPAGDLRSGIVHRAVQDKGIGRVLGRDGHRAAVKVDLAGFGDVQIDTGGVGVDGAVGVGAARLVSEGGLLKQQLVADGGDSCVFFRQQGDGVVLNSLLQSRVGSAIIAHLSSSSSSSLIGDFSVGVVASRCGNAVFPCGSQQVCEKLTGNSW